jgi:hypothetical protein
MRKIADDILAIIGDYQNDIGVQLTSQDIIDWANQFNDGDREFVLSEFLHLLNQGIYVSKVKARSLLLARIEEIRTHYKYANTIHFLEETVFLDLQNTNKSQKEILTLIDEILQNKYKLTLSDCGKSAKKNFIYFDDSVNTGRTLFTHLKYWLSQETNGISNLANVSNNSIRLIVSAFCYHTWSWENIKWRLKKELNNDEITKRMDLFFDYSIENHPRFNNQRMNFAYPIENQPSFVKTFLHQLHEGAVYNEDKAYRPASKPLKETFFSTPENRNRFESIILTEGINILSKVKKKSLQHRPLGDVSPSYKTFGTGTLFFTWRNISNTCPLVFWWHVNSGWRGLFPLQNRGTS